jgi:hypothetical protein
MPVNLADQLVTQAGEREVLRLEPLDGQLEALRLLPDLPDLRSYRLERCTAQLSHQLCTARPAHGPRSERRAVFHDLAQQRGPT